MMPQSTLQKFSSELVGGLPGRSAEGSMLAYLLSLEEAATSEDPEAAWFSISVDASKCFDTVHQVKALSSCARHEIREQHA